MPQTVTSWGAIRGHRAELGQSTVPCALSQTAGPAAAPTCRVAVSPWRGLYRWAGLRSRQAGQAQVGGAQITNAVVTGGPGGPADYLGGDVGDPPT